MTVEGFKLGATGIDLSKRLVFSTTVAASPGAAAETVVATTTAFDASVPFATGCLVFAWLAYTIGTTGASCQVRVRQTNASGAVIANTGAMTGGHNTAGQLIADDVHGIDTAPAAGQTYCVTLQVAAATAASAVSQVLIAALAI